MQVLVKDIDASLDIQKRRVGVYFLSAETFKRLFSQGRSAHFLVTEGLPEDAVFVGAEYKPSRNGVLLYFTSESYDSIWEGLDHPYEYPIRVRPIGDHHGN